MTQFLNPFSGRQFLDSNGNPYVGAKLFSYTAGTSTKATLTSNEAGTSNHTNPIILNARGEPADAGGSSQAMWQTSGVSIKLVLAPSTDTDPPLSAISTWDNLDGINDGSLISSEWIAGPAPTYISTTSFSLVGDKTTDFNVGRRLKTTNTAGTIYSTITAAPFTTLTTVTVVNDSGSLDSGLSAVSYGLLSGANNSVPGGKHEAMTFWTQGIGPNYLQNIGITATVASKALTVALKTKALADASSTDPIQIAFRNVTLTTGDYVIRSVTAATSVVAPSGATLGFTASATGYVYVYALDNAGTLEAILSGSNHWDEATVQSTTAISATSDSGSVLYSTTARTSVPIRYIGRIKIATGAVAGEWDIAPTEVHIGELKRSGRIATASGTATSFLGRATYSPTVNVYVGDIVLINYRASCVTGAAAFVDAIVVGRTSGTCALEVYPGASAPNIQYGSFPAHGASNSIENNYSIILKVVTAGTLIEVGASAVSEVGTAPTAKNSFVYSEVWRI